VADEGVDAVAGDERVRGRQRLAQFDYPRVEADLLLGLAQSGRAEVGVAGVAAAARKRDLTGVAAQVGAALGEDEAGLIVRPAEERQQDRRLDRLADQMITWTVPPSTDQAAPAT
jgi:hypothetical protein